ncbi:ATP synthase mitochondrial F1 complex assembly factor 2 [Azospirillaceae bacterium]
MKRFYKLVTVDASDSSLRILLDGKPIRTPAKSVLSPPTTALANAIAEEWRAQEQSVIPDSMPLTQFTNAAIDMVSTRRAEIVESVAAYAGSELLCYRAESPSELIERQRRHWQPLLDWAALRFDALMTVYSGVMPHPQPPEALRSLRAAVEALDVWRLTALHVMVGACGSLVVGLALLEGRISPDEAFAFSELDESYQIEFWGEDLEATKRRTRLRRDLTAVRRFVDLLS